MVDWMRHDKIAIFSTYLNVLSVAIPLSTVSGVLVRSCDASLGAIMVAQMMRGLCETMMMEQSWYEV